MSFCDVGNRGHKIEIWAKKMFFGPNFKFMPHITKTHMDDTIHEMVSKDLKKHVSNKI